MPVAATPGFGYAYPDEEGVLVLGDDAAGEEAVGASGIFGVMDRVMAWTLARIRGI
jgi:hypothetical protein